MKKRAFKVNMDYVKALLAGSIPILSLYEFLPLLNVGYFLLLIVIVTDVVKKRLSTRVNFNVLIVMSLLIMINLAVGVFKYSSITNTINNTAGMAVFAVLASLFLLSDYFERENFYKACKLIALISTFFLFFQFIEYNFFNTVIKGNIPFLKSIEKGFVSINYGRPTSFFVEPAHYAIYVAPVYAISLINKEYRISLVFLAGLVLSTSATGIVFALIIPLFIFVRGSKKHIISNITMLAAGGGALYILTNNFYDRFFEKLSINSIMTNIRTFGTLDYFRHFSTSEKWFGIGLNRLSEYLYYQGYLLYHNYANAFIFSILSFGIIGGCIWIFYSLSLYKNVLVEYRSIYYVFLLISFTDQILFNRNLLYLLLWIYTVSCYEPKVEKELMA